KDFTDREKNPAVRRCVIEALGAIGPASAPAVPDLIAVLKARDKYALWHEHVLAADALGKIGPPARAALPLLTSMANNTALHGQTRITAGQAARKIEGKTPPLLATRAPLSDEGLPAGAPFASTRRPRPPATGGAQTLPLGPATHAWRGNAKTTVR